MKRREFITGLGSATVTWPLAAWAQQHAKVWRIGYLGLGPASSWTSEVEALRIGLRDLGYIDGKNIIIEFRWAERVDQTFDLATQLVRMNVDVIFAPASTQVAPARRATNTIPIVFAQHADPVGLGDVASLSRPGGNITGMSMLLTEISVKELEILRETLPDAVRIGVLWNPTTPSHPTAVKAVEAASEKLGVQLVFAPAGTVAEITEAFATMSRERVSGVLVLSSPLYTVQGALLADLQMKHRLPEIFANRANVDAGGLVSYGADLNDLYRRAAFYVDKIFKGTSPADLPVEQASRYSMVLNLKTAKALGITIPPTVLARADEVIE
jgi:putative tryptophan/tyrosine transport system substrate-binding protein